MADIATAPDRTADTPWTMRESGWVTYGLATALYLAGAALTRPVLLGDTMFYLETATPGSAVFWDFGHLLWRPLIWILHRWVRAAGSSDPFLQTFHILDILSTVAGLLCVWLAIATLRLFTRRPVVIGVCAVLLSFSQVVLNYSKGGSAYIFGFLALSAGFYALVAATRGEGTPRDGAAIGGGFLALAVCFYFPDILAVPGLLLAPVLFSSQSGKPWRLVVEAAGVCALLGFVAYGTVAIHLGIRDSHGFFAWVATASHGAIVSGVKRVVFGIARSFISIGDGVAFKRFLLHDPYNPVHLRQLLGVTIWKILLFYAFLGLVLVRLTRSDDGRRALLQFLAVALPVLGFASAWQGSEMERCLPMFPALILAIGLGLNEVPIRSATVYIVGAFVLSVIVTNVTSLSVTAHERRLNTSTDTVSSLNALLPPESLVFLPPMHPLWRIYWDFPEVLPLAEHHLKLEWFVTLGSTDTPQWRGRACSLMSQRWNRQIPVVIESSLLLSRPKSDSMWVEGDDPRVRWADINHFISQLELGGRVGNTDFVWIPATARNVEAISVCR